MSEEYQIYRHTPAEEAKKYIHSIWIVTNGLKGIRKTEAMLAPMGYPYIHVKSGEKNEMVYRSEKYISSAFLAGQTTEPTLFEFAHDMDAIFIRLQPWGLYHFTGKKAGDFADRYWELDSVIDDMASKLKEISKSEEPAEVRGRQAEDLLLSSVSIPGIDERVVETIQKIKAKFGIVKIKELAEEVNLSTRRLQQLFDTYVGLTPKQSAKLFRLHKILYDVVMGQYPISVYDYHYDQSHFIRDFREMTHMKLDEFTEAVFTKEEKLAVKRVNLYLEDKG